MSNPTKYTITLNDEVVETKSKKATAITLADGLRAENPEATIEVRTEAGNVVHTVALPGTHAKPWTRVQEHNLDLEVPAGYTTAYVRSRVNAVVARADDKSGWVVITPEGVTEVANTTEARELTNALAVAHKETRAAEQEAEKARRAEAKRQREQDREEARAAKEQEKAEAARLKAEAKAAKEAEAEAQLADAS